MSRHREHEGSWWRTWLIARSIDGSSVPSGRGVNVPSCAAAYADTSPADETSRPPKVRPKRFGGVRLMGPR
jgi:hypothetical protein